MIKSVIHYYNKHYFLVRKIIIIRKEKKIVPNINYFSFLFYICIQAIIKVMNSFIIMYHQLINCQRYALPEIIKERYENKKIYEVFILNIYKLNN